jgi:hypothetical protein
MPSNQEKLFIPYGDGMRIPVPAVLNPKTCWNAKAMMLKIITLKPAKKQMLLT